VRYTAVPPNPPGALETPGGHLLQPGVRFAGRLAWIALAAKCEENLRRRIRPRFTIRDAPRSTKERRARHSPQSPEGDVSLAATSMELEGRRLLFVGGKGGCGKTTCACAIGLRLARERPDMRTLVVSTDPAHSVGDSFDCRVGNAVTSVDGRPNLHLLEINASAESQRFLEAHHPVIDAILERGTWLDTEDVQLVSSLSAPAMDEVMAIIKLADLLREGEFDVIIVDTAPTEHTLRLLSMPDQMAKWIHGLELMQSKHRYLARRLTGTYRKDAADIFLEALTADLRRVRNLMEDRRSTTFVVVVIPEPAAMDETTLLLEGLRRRGIGVGAVIINRTRAERDGCRFCSEEAGTQERHIEEARARFADIECIEVLAFPYQIRGTERLEEFGDVLFAEDGTAPATWDRRPPYRPAGQDVDIRLRGDAPDVEDSAEKGILYIFGGKGGVGKTSLAAATAVRIADRNPARTVLVFSTGSVSSLGGLLGVTMTSEPTPIPTVPNLFGLEIRTEQLRERLVTALREDFDAISSKTGVDTAFDSEILEELTATTPPGLEEALALWTIAEFIEGGEYDVHVFDAAATGHLLNVLASPQDVREWVTVALRILLKYRQILPPGRSAEEFVALSRRLRTVRNLLENAALCRFVAVGIPEVMGARELDRLLSSLRQLSIPCSRILINMTMPETQCGFCSIRRDEQTGVLRKIVEAYGSEYRVGVVPLFPVPITDVHHIRELVAHDAVYPP